MSSNAASPSAHIPDPSSIVAADTWEPDVAMPTSLHNVTDFFQWDQVNAEIEQETQARVAIVGLPNSGKRTLFNQLRGWHISTPANVTTEMVDINLEPYGTFLLADLPHITPMHLQSPDGLLMALGMPDLICFVLDLKQGVTQADFQWMSILRATGKPLVVAGNKIDLLPEAAPLVQLAKEKLGVRIVPISADVGTGLQTVLLPALLAAAPKLAVPLARELSGLRLPATRKLIRQAALFAGVLGAQPIPLLDFPMQAAVHISLVKRICAMQGLGTGGNFSKDVIGTLASTAALRYGVISAVKLLPIIGSVTGGILSYFATLMLGEVALQLAIRANADNSVRDNVKHYWLRSRKQTAKGLQSVVNWVTPDVA